MNKLAMTWVLAAACGGGSGGGFGPGPLTEAQADELCRSNCQHDIDCGSDQSLEACVASCVGDVVGWARADASQAILECATALACDLSDDACFAEVQPLPIHEEWEVACRSNLTECVDPTEVERLCEVTPNLQAESVGFVSLIIAPIVEEMIGCTAESACQARLDCLQAVFATHGIAF